MLVFNRLSKRYIKKALRNSAYDIEIRSCVSSTNTLMKQKALNEEKAFSVLIAQMQTAGRGRLGREFHSPKGTGIYMSVLLKPGKERNPLLITTDAAVCAACSFEKVSGQKAEIKWVNDIYIGRRKVCGILTEGVGEYAVLGIGINVIPPKKGFPEDIKNRAGAIFNKNEPHLREKVVIEFLKNFTDIYENPDREKLLCEYRRRSMVIGKEITVLKNNTSETALAIGIAEDFSLIVKKENGEIVNLNSGDVSIKI